MSLQKTRDEIKEEAYEFDDDMIKEEDLADDEDTVFA